MPSVLTDSARVVALLDSAVTGKLDGHNALIEALVVQTSDAIERYLGRTLEETTHTEYLDGDGSGLLLLMDGPIVSVTSVEYVTYSDAGGGARQEDLTVIEAYTYLERGLRAEGAAGRGSLELLYTGWLPGRRNYKVVYVAGWEALDTGGSNDIPEAIVAQATREVASRFNTRSMEGLASRTVGDGAIDLSTIPQHALDATRMRALSAFRIPEAR